MRLTKGRGQRRAVAWVQTERCAAGPQRAPTLFTRLQRGQQAFSRKHAPSGPLAARAPAAPTCDDEVPTTMPRLVFRCRKGTSSVEMEAVAAKMGVLTTTVAEMEEKPSRSSRMAVVLPGLKPAGRELCGQAAVGQSGERLVPLTHRSLQGMLPRFEPPAPGMRPGRSRGRAGLGSRRAPQGGWMHAAPLAAPLTVPATSQQGDRTTHRPRRPPACSSFPSMAGAAREGGGGGGAGRARAGGRRGAGACGGASAAVAGAGGAAGAAAGCCAVFWTSPMLPQPSARRSPSVAFTLSTCRAANLQHRTDAATLGACGGKLSLLSPLC